MPYNIVRKGHSGHMDKNIDDKYSEFKNNVNVHTSMLSSEDFINEINAVKPYIEKSAKLDKDRWGTHNNPGRNNYVEYFKSCITDRVDYIKNNPF